MATKPICAATRRRRAPSAKLTAFWPDRRSSPQIHKRSAHEAAGATGGRRRSPPMTGSCAPIIHSFWLSSPAPNRPARCVVCCAIRLALPGSMRLDGVNLKAAQSRLCSMHSGSAISSTWSSSALCANSKSEAASFPPARKPSMQRWQRPRRLLPPTGKARVRFHRPSSGGALSTTLA